LESTVPVVDGKEYNYEVDSSSAFYFTGTISLRAMLCKYKVTTSPWSWWASYELPKVSAQAMIVVFLLEKKHVTVQNKMVYVDMQRYSETYISDILRKQSLKMSIITKQIIIHQLPFNFDRTGQ